jgi:hypothetical protein
VTRVKINVRIKNTVRVPPVAFPWTAWAVLAIPAAKMMGADFMGI